MSSKSDDEVRSGGEWDGELHCERKKVKCARNRREIVRFVSPSMITDLLKDRYNNNLNVRAAALKNNMTLSMGRNIIEKYGKDYLVRNNLSTSLPDVETMVEHWDKKESS